MSSSSLLVPLLYCPTLFLAWKNPLAGFLCLCFTLVRIPVYGAITPSSCCYWYMEFCSLSFRILQSVKCEISVSFRFEVYCKPLNIQPRWQLWCHVQTKNKLHAVLEQYIPHNIVPLLLFKLLCTVFEELGMHRINY